MTRSFVATQEDEANSMMSFASLHSPASHVARSPRPACRAKCLHRKVDSRRQEQDGSRYREDGSTKDGATADGAEQLPGIDEVSGKAAQQSHGKFRNNREELEIEVAVDSKKPPNRVIESAVVRRRGVLLNVTRVEVVKSRCTRSAQPGTGCGDRETVKSTGYWNLVSNARKAGKRPALFSGPMKFQS